MIIDWARGATAQLLAYPWPGIWNWITGESGAATTTPFEPGAVVMHETTLRALMVPANETVLYTQTSEGLQPTDRLIPIVRAVPSYAVLETEAVMVLD